MRNAKPGNHLKVISIIGDLEGASSNPGQAIFCTFFSFYFCDHFFPWGLFPFIITADPFIIREAFAITSF